MNSQAGSARQNLPAQQPAWTSSTAHLKNAKPRSHNFPSRRSTRELCLLEESDLGTVAAATVISCGVPISSYTQSEALAAVSGKAFGCTMCGKCCTLAGDAEVWLNRKELEGVAAFLGVSIDSAIQSCMQPYEQVPGWYLLQSKSISGPWPFDAQHSQQEQQPGTTAAEPGQQQQQRQVCVFLDAATNACSIYPVRPLQCSTYPWWPEIMSGPNWAVTAISGMARSHDT